jgi:hypothetical protein
MLPGVTTTFPGAAGSICNETGTTTLTASGDAGGLIITVPLRVPTVAPTGALTVTVKVFGVMPLVGEILSHGAPETLTAN